MKSSVIILFIIFISLSALFFSCSEQTDEPQLSVDERLQKALDDIIANSEKSKGISAAVIFPDGHIWKGAAGISHENKEITTETLFSAGSTTKSFTAVTIMKMVADGMLSLDDPLSMWFPDYPNIDSMVTIRQLLNHTSGIFNVTENPLLWQEIFQNPQKIWTADDVLNGYILEPYFDRGTGWHYCNTGYIMLRKLICDLNQSNIGQVYRQRIFNPVGLENTFCYVDETLPDNVAHGWFDLYSDNTYDDLTSIGPFLSFYSAAGGGVFATALDLAYWAKDIFIDGTVVTTEQLDQMMDFYTTISDQPLLSGYGLGLVHFNPDLFNGLTVYGHSGDAPGYAAGSLYIADYDVCLGIADNTEEGEAMWVINDLLSIISDEMDKSE